MKASNREWTDILDAPDADNYMYRLINEDGHPVGKWGPSVAFTRNQAKASMFATLGTKVYWIRCGTRLYSVE